MYSWGDIEEKKVDWNLFLAVLDSSFQLPVLSEHPVIAKNDDDEDIFNNKLFFLDKVKLGNKKPKFFISKVSTFLLEFELEAAGN